MEEQTTTQAEQTQAKPVPERKPFVAKMILSKSHDISAFVSDDETRYALCGVHYDATRRVLEATNGNMLIEVPVLFDNGDEFPESSTAGEALTESVTIPIGKFQRAMANLKSLYRTTLEILKHVLVTCDKKDGKLNRVRLTTNDLDDETTIRTKVIEANFPDTGHLWAATAETPKFEIYLNAVLLGKICEYAKQATKGGHNTPIKFTFYGGERAPVKFEIKTADDLTAKGLLAPLMN